MVFYPTIVHSQPSLSPTQSVINGLYTPTNSQRFFEAGRRDFEQEIERFQEPKITTNDLLKIDPEITAQKQILSQQQWLYDLLSAPNNLPPQEKE